MSNSDNCLHFRLKCSNTATQRTRHNSTHDPIQTMFGIYYQEIHGPLFHQSDTTTLYLLWWQPMSLQQFCERPKQWHLQPEESWQEGLNSSDAGRAKPTSSIFTDSWLLPLNRSYMYTYHWLVHLDTIHDPPTMHICVIGYKTVSHITIHGIAYLFPSPYHMYLQHPCMNCNTVTCIILPSTYNQFYGLQVVQADYFRKILGCKLTAILYASLQIDHKVQDWNQRFSPKSRGVSTPRVSQDIQA